MTIWVRLETNADGDKEAHEIIYVNPKSMPSTPVLEWVEGDEATASGMIYDEETKTFS